MSFDLETFYSLLPAVYRIGDLEQRENSSSFQQQNTNGGDQLQLPLKALLKVIAEQIDVLAENLAQLYDDQFIETCAEWAIPYIGDLVSYHTPHNTSSQSLRSEVAHTISYRKRKGTTTLLEQLVHDVTGWDAHIVEMFQLLAATQHLHRVRPENSLVDLRKDQGEPLARLNTPFDSLMHTADVRNLAPRRGGYNIPTIGIFIWRLSDYSLTQTPAVRAVGNDERCYFFSPLGNNLHLLTHPQIEEDVTQLAGPRAVAMPINRCRLAHFLSDYYGRGKSILLTVTVDRQDIDILPNPKYPSNRLKPLITTAGLLNYGLDVLEKGLAANDNLDLAKLQDLIATSEDLHNGLDDLYRVQLSAENRDLAKLAKLLTMIDDLKRGLEELSSIDNKQSQLLRLTALTKLSTAVYESLKPGDIDPQGLDDLITITDLSDRVKKDADGKPVMKKDASGNTIPVKEEDSGGNPIWANLPEDRIAIDPVLGRFAFPQNMASLLERLGLSTDEKIFKNVRGTFYYGFSADMGGGEYHRVASFTSGLKNFQRVSAQLDDIQEALEALKAPPGPDNAPQDGIVEITESGRVEGLLAIQASANQRIELRAADFSRPLLVLEDKTDPPTMVISGEVGSRVTLNGLVISHGTLRISGNLERLTLRHCTLVPGISLSVENEPQHPVRPSLIVESPYTLVEIDHSIVGGLHVIESTRVRITNSIVDATSKDRVAYAGLPAAKLGGESSGGPLHIEDSTIIGRVRTLAMELASNTIFLAHGAVPVDVTRQQEGCMRFSYVPHGSRTPRRYHCQPTEEDGKKQKAKHLEPQFTSLRYGHAGYCQLLQRSAVRTSQGADDEAQAQPGLADKVEVEQAKNEARIRQGADDEAEMGAFHDLFQPQRETNLRMRLAEYLRFTMEPGIVYLT